MFTIARAPRHLLAAALTLAALLAGAGRARAQAIQAGDVDDSPRPDSIADPSAPADIEGSYGYFRVVEGAATVLPAGAEGRDARAAGTPAAVNQPLRPGDRIQVADRGRVEIVLSDRNLLRLDGGSDVVLERLAGTPDTNDRATQLRLLEGNFQLIVVQDSLGDQLPRVDTPNSTIYVQYPGSYRITSDSGNWSSVVVRRGSVEVVTDRGSLRVRADEEAHVEGEQSARTDIAQASGFDAVERWGRDLDAQLVDNPYLDQRLAYQAAPLSRYGSWLQIGGQPYWRPTVEGGWRPFTDGYWAPTASGLTWVATEPWGWVPYHYGSWDYVDGYGWVWAPGYVYSPAWVYWYWGPTQIGWCPVGYYTRWYGHHFHDPAFRSGVYGWAGGDWGLFGNWNFVAVNHFGHRDLGRWVRRGGHGADAVGDLRGDMQGREMPRGIITTDTRGITPGRWNHPDQVLNVLRNRGGDRNGMRNGGNLPDVTSFVARKPNLPPQVLRAVTADTPDRGRFTGTPLRPATQSTPPATPTVRSRWTARTPTGGVPGVATPTGTPAGPDTRGDRNGRFRHENGTPPTTGTATGVTSAVPATPTHTWDRRSDTPRAVPRPDAGSRGEQPATHAWDRRPGTTGTAGTGTGTAVPRGQAWRERPATATPTPATPPTPGPTQRGNGWREVPTHEQPGVPSAQRPAPAPRYTPPTERYSPPPPTPRYTPPPATSAPSPRYTPPAPRYTPPPATSAPPPHNPPPQQRERPQERPAAKPPEHHGH